MSTDDATALGHAEPASSASSLSRRDALHRAGQVGLGLALAAVPGAFLSARKAQAQDVAPAEVLSFALTLEYLEWQYYEQALSDDSSLSFPGDAEEKFTEIRDHELAHVRFLEDQLDLSEDENRPAFDFTAGGMFDPGPFEDYPTFLLLAQAFEDTGVRAYKGGAPALIGDPALTPALQIHATEAAHVSVVRRMVAAEGLAPGQDAWVEGAGAQAPDALSGYMSNAIYTGEDDTSVAGNDVSGVGDYSDELVTEAYDKPLGMSAVNGIVKPFLGSGGGGGGDENLITGFEDPNQVGSGQPISVYKNQESATIVKQEVENGQFVAELENYGGNGNFSGSSIKLGGIGFETPVDFTETPVFQLDVKVSEDSNKDLPIGLKTLGDSNFFGPNDTVITETGALNTYYFDLSGGGDKLSAVDEIIIYLNAGDVDPFTGTVTLDNFRRRESVPDDA
jgi:hypothetical protein